MSIKRVGEPPRSGKAYTRRPGVYAILERNGSLLLTHQQEPVPEIQLPGGGIDADEHPITALHREVLEETGWRISSPIRVGAFRRFTFMPEYDLWAEKLCHVFLARPISCLGPPTEAGHTALWAAPDMAAEVVGNPGDALFIQQVFGLVTAR